MAYIKRNWILLTVLFGAFLSIGVLIVNTNKAAEKVTYNLPEIRDIKTVDPWFARFAYVPAQAGNIMGRTIGTSYQPSLQRMAIVAYNVTITNAATVLLGNSGQVILETSPDNSTWTTISTGASSMGSGILVTSISTVTVLAFVPRGYYARIRTVNVTGTPTYSAPAGIEVLFN